MNRLEAVEVLDQGHRELTALIASLEEERACQPRALGGGDWSVKDLIGHVETWEQVALDNLDDFRNGVPARIGQIVTDRASLDAFNLNEVRRKADSPWSVALDGYEKTHRRLVDEISEMSDEEWDAPLPDQPTETVGTRLGSNTGAPRQPFGHVFAHLDDVREFVEGREP